jgi:hypothetical protein
MAGLGGFFKKEYNVGKRVKQKNKNKNTKDYCMPAPSFFGGQQINKT